jgi:hypothetical protein
MAGVEVADDAGEVVGELPQRPNIHPPGRFCVGVGSVASVDVLDSRDVGRLLSPIVERNNELLSYFCRDIVGVVSADVKTGCTFANEVDGMLRSCLGRSRAGEPANCNCDGRDLRVWISMPEIERMDS